MSVVSSAYLRLLVFLPAILILACASSSPAFPMMYSAYELNKQGDDIQPWHTPFLIWNQSVVPCPVLTVVSWPAYRFLRRQVRWSGIPISLICRIKTQHGRHQLLYIREEHLRPDWRHQRSSSRLSETSSEECRPCTHSNLIGNPTLELLL